MNQRAMRRTLQGSILLLIIAIYALIAPALMPNRAYGEWESFDDQIAQTLDATP